MAIRAAMAMAAPDIKIRCEINEVPYERGAVGMALSGQGQPAGHSGS